MKKVIFSLMIAAFLVEPVCGQQESFDIVNYTPPAKWTKDAKQKVVTYTTIDTTAGTFCVLTLHASTPSSGDAEKDFKSEWKELAVQPFKADANPSTEIVSADGWKAVTGASLVKIDDIDTYVILTVISGFGKTISIVANLNNEQYLAQYETFLGNMTLDKAAPVAKQTNSTIKQSSTSGEKFGHMTFQPMKGWSVQKYGSAVIMKPLDLSKEHMLEVRILEPKPFTGSLTTAMTESWNDLLKQVNLEPAYNGKLYDVIRERKSYKGWEYIRARGMARAPGTTDKYDTYLFVIKLNNRIERIAVIGFNNISYGSFSPHANPEYEEALEDFYFSLQFDDWKEPDIQPASLKGNGLIGLYEGLKLTGGSLKGAYTVFFSNGQVFHAPKFPTRGLHGLNTWADAERHTGYWGTYTLKNGKGFINLPSGNIPIKVVGQDLIATTQNTEHKYEKVPSLDGAVFNGTYYFKGDWGKINPSIKFTTDGNFIDYGAVNIMHHATTDFFNIAEKPGNGKYEVKDYTLILYYNDGRKIQIVFQDSGYDKKNPGPPTLTFSTNHDILYKK